MNTFQLEQILNNDKYAMSVFQGVRARDEFIRETLTFPSAYIVNTDNSNQPGSHWLAIWLTSNNTVEYFDSYGLPPIYSDISEKLFSITDHIIFNNFRLQDPTTVVCGHYCLLFCLLKARGCTLDSIIKVFRPALTHEQRDHYLAEFIEDNYLSVILQFDANYSKIIASKYHIDDELCHLIY